MSLFHPETAEDQMAWVPIIGCFVPLVIVIIATIVILVKVL